jgi:hypothetical protein
MTQEHPITPSPELVKQWVAEIWHEGTPVRVSLSDEHIATRAAQWGADQELEACCEYLVRCAQWEPEDVGELRAVRRPKPQSLNSIALEMLGTIEKMAVVIPEITDTIRRALEALPE